MASGGASDDATRLRVVRFSMAFSVAFSLVCSRWTGSDGRSAVALDVANVALLGVYAIRCADRTILGVFLAAAAFGVVELLADFLCVRCTGTLDYSVARSLMVLESPWWMPFSWAVVAVQMSISGDAAIRRFGLARGMIAAGLLGSLLIPWYEEMAWGGALVALPPLPANRAHPGLHHGRGGGDRGGTGPARVLRSAGVFPARVRGPGHRCWVGDGCRRHRRLGRRRVSGTGDAPCSNAGSSFHRGSSGLAGSANGSAVTTRSTV